MYFKPPHTRLDIRLTPFLSAISAYFRFKQGWCFILYGEEIIKLSIIFSCVDVRQTVGL